MDERFKPKLLFVTGEEPGQTLFIPNNEVILGSGSGADFLLRYEGVSRRHASLKSNAG